MAFDAGHTAKPGAVDFAIRFANMRMNTHYTLADAACVSRKAHLVTFRMNVAWALRYFSKWSYPRIGFLLGNRDHATIMSLCRKFERQAQQGTLFLDQSAAYSRLPSVTRVGARQILEQLGA